MLEYITYCKEKRLSIDQTAETLVGEVSQTAFSFFGGYRPSAKNIVINLIQNILTLQNTNAELQKQLVRSQETLRKVKEAKFPKNKSEDVEG